MIRAFYRRVGWAGHHSGGIRLPVSRGATEGWAIPQEIRVTVQAERLQGS